MDLAKEDILVAQGHLELFAIRGGGERRRVMTPSSPRGRHSASKMMRVVTSVQTVVPSFLGCSTSRYVGSEFLPAMASSTTVRMASRDDLDGSRGDDIFNGTGSALLPVSRHATAWMEGETYVKWP